MADLASSKSLKGVTVLLAVMAAGLAGLLLYQSQTLEALPGCGGGSGCSTVLASKWSSWLGLPVSLLALGVYIAMLSAVVMRDTESRRPQPGAEWVMVCSGVAVLVAALWFVIVQVVIVGSFCLYCMATHVSAGVAAVLCLLAAQPSRWLKSAASAGGVAVGLMAVLIVGQVMGDDPEAVAPQIHIVEAAPADPVESEQPSSLFTNPVPELAPPAPKPDPVVKPPAGTGTKQTVSPLGPRKLAFYGGRFKLDTTNVPIIGDPHAPKVLVVIFDYNCDHCRETRVMLEKTKQKHGDKLAIICLPTPLSSKCNKLVTRTHPNNRYSCELAEASLAVWRVAPDKWEEFDKRLYTDADIRTAARSQIAAWELLGGEKAFKQGQDDPWVKKRISTNVSIYEVVGKTSGSALLPMLVTETGVMTGAPRHPLDIDDLLLGLKVPRGGSHAGQGH